MRFSNFAVALGQAVVHGLTERDHVHRLGKDPADGVVRTGDAAQGRGRDQHDTDGRVELPYGRAEVVEAVWGAVRRSG